MLSNAYFLAKFRFDTAENEPAQNLQKFAIFVNFANPNSLTPKGSLRRPEGRAATRGLRCARGAPRRGGLRLAHRVLESGGPPKKQRAKGSGPRRTILPTFPRSVGHSLSTVMWIGHAYRSMIKCTL